MAHPYDLEVFYDGGCPLCRREIDMLRRCDSHGRIRFTDIDAADFAPESTGRSYEDLMARIQARLPDGTWIEGVEVFRRLYAAAGFRRLVRFSRLPIMAPSSISPTASSPATASASPAAAPRPYAERNQRSPNPLSLNRVVSKAVTWRR